MLSFDVADEHWDHEAGWYDREVVPMLDLKSVLNSDKVILIDTGDIHGESSKMFTVLFLSHLWTSVRSIWTPNDDDYIANVIIEESADVARTEIVYEDLLPKGREFNLSLGLIMRYPEQVLGTTTGEPAVLQGDPQQHQHQDHREHRDRRYARGIAVPRGLRQRRNQKDRIAGLRRGEWVVQLHPRAFTNRNPRFSP